MMIDLEAEEKKKVTALLIGDPGKDLSELKGLVDTLGLGTVRKIRHRDLRLRQGFADELWCRG